MKKLSPLLMLLLCGCQDLLIPKARDMGKVLDIHDVYGPDDHVFLDLSLEHDTIMVDFDDVKNAYSDSAWVQAIKLHAHDLYDDGYGHAYVEGSIRLLPFKHFKEIVDEL